MTYSLVWFAEVWDSLVAADPRAAERLRDKYPELAELPIDTRGKLVGHLWSVTSRHVRERVDVFERHGRWFHYDLTGRALGELDVEAVKPFIQDYSCRRIYTDASHHESPGAIQC